MDTKEPRAPSPIEGPIPKERDYAAPLPPAPVPVTATDVDEDPRNSKDGHESDTDSDTTATNDSDKFNWDDDDEVKESSSKVKAKRGRLLYLAFMKLARPIRTLIVGILGAGICITPLIVVQLRFPNSSAKLTVHVWSLWITIIWATSCATYLLVDIIPKIIVRLINLFGGQVERLKLQIELVMAVSAWLKLALDVSWAWIALSVIRAVYEPSGRYWMWINRVMQALFSASLILLVEKIFLQFVAINFHQKALADRLAENRLGLRALDRLSNAHPAPRKSPYGRNGRGHRTPTGSVDLFNRRQSNDMLTPGPTTSAQEKGQSLTTESNKVTRGERKKKRKKAVAVVIVDQLGDAIGQVALKNSKFNRGAEYGSLYSARKLARKLFSNLSDVYPPRSHLIVEDFEPYFRTTEEAHQAFHVFDKDGNGDISKREMREAVQRIYRERKALVASLKDVGSAVAKLDAVLLAVALVAIIFVCLLIFNRENTLASLVPLATVVLGFSFIFGNSAQTLFNSLIFIFSTHVFDVGDLVLIDEQPLVVREFGLFSTTFRRVDGQEIVAPNALLASAKLIHNLRRSNSMVETTNLMIAYNTPLEIVEELRNRMTLYTNEHNREWVSCALHIDKMEFQNAIHLIVAMEHRPNWQDWGGRWSRRTAFMRNLKTILEDLDIRYSMPVQPVILPRGAPGHVPPSQGIPPPSPYTASREDLGNAGSFQGGPHVRAPRRAFRGDNAPFSDGGA